MPSHADFYAMPRRRYARCYAYALPPLMMPLSLYATAAATCRDDVCLLPLSDAMFSLVAYALCAADAGATRRHCALIAPLMPLRCHFARVTPRCRYYAAHARATDAASAMIRRHCLLIAPLFSLPPLYYITPCRYACHATPCFISALRA